MPRIARPWYWKSRQCWYVQVNGKQVRLDPDKQVAFAKYARVMAGEGILVDDEGQIGVPLAVDLFVDKDVRPGRQAGTYVKYLKNLAPFAVAFRDRAVASLTHAEVEAYCARATDWSHGYRHAVFSDVGTLLRWCRDKGHIASNPLAGAKNPWPPGGRAATMTREEFDRILAVVPDPQFRLLLRVLYYTGCRPGEAYKLCPRHLDPILPRATLGAKEHKTGHWTGKTRPIWFPKDVMAEVRQLAALREDGEVILRNTAGRKWIDSNVATRFKRAVDRAGLAGKGLVPYSNRHSFITQLVHSGESTPLIAKLVGHTNDRTLQRVYLHEDEAVVSEIVERRSSQGGHGRR